MLCHSFCISFFFYVFCYAFPEFPPMATQFPPSGRAITLAALGPRVSQVPSGRSSMLESPSVAIFFAATRFVVFESERFTVCAGLLHIILRVHVSAICFFVSTDALIEHVVCLFVDLLHVIDKLPAIFPIVIFPIFFHIPRMWFSWNAQGPCDKVRSPGGRV